MQYKRLGSSGLKISRICVGCVQFGRGEPWMIELDEAKRVFNKAWDLGINFFDTANGYSKGRSEEILGALAKDAREEAVLATKVYGAMGDGPNDSGLSAKHIRWQCNESLRRLGTSYLDLYQIHRWDYTTPIEETLSVLNELVDEGKVLYIGASSMWAWQFSKSLHTSDAKNYARFVSMQNLYNLLYREEEREMIPLCIDESIGLIPYSPTAVGVLSGRYLQGGTLRVEDTDIQRLRKDGEDYKVYIEPSENAVIVRRVIDVALEKGVKPVQVAIAWLLHRGADAPIIGTTKVEHVQDAVDAVELKLSDKQIAYLEEPYRPRPISGHS